MKNLSLNTRLVLNFSIVAAIGMFLAGFLSYRYCYDQVYNLTIMDLTNRLKSIETSIQISNNENLDRQKRLSLKLKEKIFPRLGVDFAITKLQKVENQITHEKSEEIVPTFLIDDKAISNNDLVDKINEDTGSSATLFLKIRSGFLRMSTNVKRPDGTRATGTYIPLDSPVSKKILSGESFYGRAFVVSDWYITAYEPIFSKNHEVIGAFYVGTKETSQEQIKSYIKGQKILKTGYYYVLDNEGKMIIHPTLEGKNVFEQTDADGKYIFKDIIKGNSGVIEYRWKAADSTEIKDKTAIYFNFPLMSWHVVASFYTDEVKEGIYQLRTVIIGITLFSLLIMAIFIAWYAGRTSRLIDSVTNKITQTSKLINEQSSLISDVSVKLSDSSTKQASALEETASTLDEITATVQNNLATTRQSKSLSIDIQKITDHGFNVMKNLNASVNEVNQQNNLAKEEIQKSYHDIASIIELIHTVDEKTKVINDIVFQTKLLSFNASVEAARAGEQGKGFSVVAEEIGKLATMTGASAIQIQETLLNTSDKVKEIISSSEKRVIQALEASSKEIVKCSSISKEGIIALENITTNVTNSAESIANLTNASEEQSSAIGNISIAVQQIDQVTHTTSELSTESQNYSQKLNEQSKDLEAAIKLLKDLVHGEMP